ELYSASGRGGARHRGGGPAIPIRADIRRLVAERRIGRRDGRGRALGREIRELGEGLADVGKRAPAGKDIRIGGMLRFLATPPTLRSAQGGLCAPPRGPGMP